MKEYKVEPLRFIQKGTDSNQLITESKAGIQAKLDEYALKGYKLTSLTSADSGMVYLVFEKDI
jgi:hypothetical protein